MIASDWTSSSKPPLLLPQISSLAVSLSSLLLHVPDLTGPCCIFWPSLRRSGCPRDGSGWWLRVSFEAGPSSEDEKLSRILLPYLQTSSAERNNAVLICTFTAVKTGVRKRKKKKSRDGGFWDCGLDTIIEKNPRWVTVWIKQIHTVCNTHTHTWFLDLCGDPLLISIGKSVIHIHTHAHTK